MKEITKEDWERVLDENNPNFEEDFNELVARYLIRSEEEKKSQKTNFIDRIRVKINFGAIKEIFDQDNWIIDQHIEGEVYMDSDRLVTERYKQTIDLLESLGMMSEYLEFYEKSEESKERFLKLYSRLLKEQRKRVPLIHRINGISYTIMKKYRELNKA